MRYEFQTVDVFSDRAFGGNPLAVILDARGLDDDTMQSVAREFNYSETVFLFPPEDRNHTRRLRIFTSSRELPFAGHPTVGAAFVLAATGEIRSDGEWLRAVFEEGVGPVPVSVRFRSGVPVYSELTVARLPERAELSAAPADVAHWLGLQEEALLGHVWMPEIWSCGVPFLFAPLRDLDAVRAARPPGPDARADIRATGAHGLFPFCLQSESGEAELHGRMYAPEFGFFEDPATGGAAAAMAGYLASRADSPSNHLFWRLEQGFEMGRPSMLRIEADRRGSTVTAVRVGGQSVMVCSGAIDIPVGD